MNASNCVIFIYDKCSLNWGIFGIVFFKICLLPAVGLEMQWWSFMPFGFIFISVYFQYCIVSLYLFSLSEKWGSVCLCVFITSGS